jgi:nucleoside-diphosphate-sugar epimerase
MSSTQVSKPTGPLEKILVTGATGQQGGTLAKLLLQKTHKVYALIRNIYSPAAQELKKEGANLVKGDLNNLEQVVYQTSKEGVVLHNESCSHS